MADCPEFAVPDAYFATITPLVVEAIPIHPAATDQLVKYLRAVPTNNADLAKVADHLRHPDRSFYRPLAKRMFLAFCYGMTAEGIAKLIAGQAGNESELGRYRASVEGFFGSFPGLARYRAEMASELETRGFVASQLGNRRYRLDMGPLTSAERRWALNQPIQSTASLIFKEALLALAGEFDFNSIVLPVHDAVLMQFDANEDFDTKVEMAQKLRQQWIVKRNNE